MSQPELARIAALFDAHPWVFAKTMPLNPHWYTLRKQWESEEDFEWAVQFIRSAGYVGTYGRTRYTYLDVGEYFYWTMGSPVAKTILINRAATATPSGLNTEGRQGLA